MVLPLQCAVYRLGGKAEQAAISLCAAQKQKGALSQSFEELKILGYDAPALRIYEDIKAYPRAYLEYPQLFKAPDELGRFFLFVPLNYKHQHFVPEDSFRVGPQSLREVYRLLFKARRMASPLISVPAQGTAMPRGYFAPAEKELRRSFSCLSDIVVFVASSKTPPPQGASLEEIEGMRFFVYKLSPENEKKFIAPAGLKSFSIPAYKWLAADARDVQVGRRPPPRPHIVDMALQCVRPTGAVQSKWRRLGG